MSAVVEVMAGGLRWRLPREHRDLLLDAGGLRLDAWLRQGQAWQIKHASHRSVYRVELPGLSFYLKRNRQTDLRARLREWFRPAKALSEYDRALLVAKRGIPTFIPLAVGVSCRGAGDSYLLTHTLGDTRQLNTFLEQELPAWAGERQTRVRTRLARVLGDLLARMHDAGIVHHDLHAGNILVRIDEADEPRLYLIDLQAVEVGSPLSWARSRENLVIINRWFILRSERADRLRFWKAYWSARQTCPGEDIRARAKELEERTLASNRGFWRSLDGRCLETNRRFRRVRARGVVGHAVADLEAGLLESLLADPDAPFRQEGVRLLKDSRSSTVAELNAPINGIVQPMIYKRFRLTSWKDPLLALLRPTGGLRSWVLGHGMRLRWLPTPRPLLVLHRRRGLPREGYLLTAKVQDAEDLHDFMERMTPLSTSERRAQLRPILEATARLVRDLHQRQLSHRDLKAPNLLVTPEARPDRQTGSAEPLDHWPLTNSRVWFIDLVGVRIHRRLDRGRRIQNLARLNASFVNHTALSRTDRLRFLLLYLEVRLRVGQDWKGWWREIEVATRRKIAQNARRGRPLY